MTRFVEDTYSKIAQAYTDEFFDDTFDVPFIDCLMNAVKPGGKILDIGSGPGQFSAYIKKHGFVVQGVDTSEAMIKIANAMVADVKFSNMDMRQLTFADATFDGILAAYSIIHIPTKELPSVLLEMHRVLKQPGYALFIVQEGQPDQIVDEPLARGEKIFMNFFTESRLNALLAEAGFTVVSGGKVDQASEDALSSSVIWTLTKT